MQSDPVDNARPLEPGEAIDPRAGLVQPRPVSQPEPPVPGWLKRGTDLYLAWRLVSRHQHEIRYCHAYAKGCPWYIWTGAWWQRDLDQQVMGLAVATAKVIGDEIYSEIKVLQELHGDDPPKEIRAKLSALRSEQKMVQDGNKLKKALCWAGADARIAVTPEDFDRNPYLLPAGNGTIDLRTGEIRPPDPKDLLTRGTTVPFHTDLKKIDQAAQAALDRVLAHMATATPGATPDQDLIRYYQQSLGNSLYGHNDLELFYLAHGAAASGKSTLFEGIKSSIGSGLAVTAEAKTFVKEKNYRVRDDLQRLHGARIVISAEQDRGEQLSAGVVNILAGGDTATSRALYSIHEEHRATFTCWLQVNNLPYIDRTEVGIRRRLVVVPMGQTVPDDQRDPQLKRILLDPLRGGPAILRWLVAGAVATHRARAIERPAAVRQATAAYWSTQDQGADFLVEALRFATPGRDDLSKVFCLVEDVTRAYHQWCDDNRIPDRYRLSGRRLDERLRELGIAKRRTVRVVTGQKINRWWYFGATLVPGLSTENRAEGSTLVPDQAAHEAACCQLGLIDPEDSKIPSSEHGLESILESPNGLPDNGLDQKIPRFQENPDQVSHVCARARACDLCETVESWNLGILEKEQKEETGNRSPPPPDLDDPYQPGPES